SVGVGVRSSRNPGNLDPGPGPRAGECLGDAVVGVAPGAAIRVDPGWWNELGVAVGGDTYPPAVVVHAGVVVRTYQHQISQRGGAAVGPVPDVVRLAPGGGPGTAGEGTSTVARHERGPLLRGHGAAAAVGVQLQPERVSN